MDPGCSEPGIMKSGGAKLAAEISAIGNAPRQKDTISRSTASDLWKICGT